MSRIIRTPFERALALFILGLFGLIIVFPFLYMFASSLKEPGDVVRVPPELFPAVPMWGNYAEVLQVVPIGTQLLNSAIVTVGVTIGWLLTSTLSGYAFARLQFPGRDLLFTLFLGTLMVPFVVLIVPMYQIMVGLSWVDKLVALIVPWVSTAYGTFLLRQAFLALPKELEEAAQIDGANRWGVLFQVYLPLVVPALATLATLAFLYSWNSFTWPLIVISNPQTKVVTQGLMDLQGLYAGTRLNLVLAGSTLAVAPTLIVYLFAQRYFIEGVATTGLAGR